MTTQSIYTEEYHVRTFELDFQRIWKPSWIFQLLTEAATHHASHLGFDYHDLWQNNQAWVLSRMKVRFLKYPTDGQKIILHTWPRGIVQKLLFMRDFELLDEAGEPVMLATSAWVLVDTQARRFLLPQVLKTELPDNNGRSVMDETLDKLSGFNGMQPCLEVNPGYSEVDLVGHVNNARYVEWIANCFSLEQHQNQRIEWMQVNYLAEVKAGERVALSAAPSTEDGQRWLVEGNNLTSGARAFEAAVQWQAA
jgi:acyl-ACP thioesterase